MCYLKGLRENLVWSWSYGCHRDHLGHWPHPVLAVELERKQMWPGPTDSPGVMRAMTSIPSLLVGKQVMHLLL